MEAQLPKRSWGATFFELRMTQFVHALFRGFDLRFGRVTTFRPCPHLPSVVVLCERADGAGVRNQIPSTLHIQFRVQLFNQAHSKFSSAPKSHLRSITVLGTGEVRPEPSGFEVVGSEGQPTTLRSVRKCTIQPGTKTGNDATMNQKRVLLPREGKPTTTEWPTTKHMALL